MAELPAHPRDYTDEHRGWLMVTNPVAYDAARDVLLAELVEQAGDRAAAAEWRHLKAMLRWFFRRWRRG